VRNKGFKGLWVPRNKNKRKILYFKWRLFWKIYVGDGVALNDRINKIIFLYWIL